MLPTCLHLLTASSLGSQPPHCCWIPWSRSSAERLRTSQAHCGRFPGSSWGRLSKLIIFPSPSMSLFALLCLLTNLITGHLSTEFLHNSDSSNPSRKHASSQQGTLDLCGEVAPGRQTNFGQFRSLSVLEGEASVVFLGISWNLIPNGGAKAEILDVCGCGASCRDRMKT